MVLLTTVTVLISYLATVMVYTRLVFTKSNGLILNWKSGFMIFLGISFSSLMIVGSGLEAIRRSRFDTWLTLISLDQNKIMITCHSEYGKLKSLLLSPAANALQSQEKINREWEMLFYLEAINFDGALAEYADFQEMVGKEAELHFLQKSGGEHRCHLL